MRIDAAKNRSGRLAPFVQPRVAFSGPDAGLNQTVNAFAEFDRKHRNELSTQYRGVMLRAIAAAKDTKAAANRKDAFDSAIAKLREIRDLELARLAAFAPPSNGEFLKNEISAEFFVGAIMVADNYRQRLEGTPIWTELLAHRFTGATRDQVSVFSYLGFYLSSRVSRGFANLEQAVVYCEAKARCAEFLQARLARPEFIEKSAEFAPLVAVLKQKVTNYKDVGTTIDALNTLIQAGVWDSAWDLFDKMETGGRQLSVPPLLLDLVLLKNLPEQPMPGVEIAERVKTVAGSRWTARLAAAAASERKASLEDATEMIARIEQSPAAILEEGGALSLGLLECGADLYEFPNQEPEAIIAWLRAKYPGKALLIDVWGPWCGPCVAAFPRTKQLLKEIEADLIVPVYLAGRTNPVAWKQGIARYGLTGLHVLLSDTQAAGMLTRLGGGGYPTYGLIDVKGRLTLSADVRGLLDKGSAPALAEAARGTAF